MLRDLFLIAQPLLLGEEGKNSPLHHLGNSPFSPRWVAQTTDIRTASGLRRYVVDGPMSSAGGVMPSAEGAVSSAGRAVSSEDGSLSFAEGAVSCADGAVSSAH